MGSSLSSQGVLCSALAPLKPPPPPSHQRWNQSVHFLDGETLIRTDKDPSSSFHKCSSRYKAARLDTSRPLSTETWRKEIINLIAIQVWVKKLPGWRLSPSLLHDYKEHSCRWGCCVVLRTTGWRSAPVCVGLSDVSAARLVPPNSSSLVMLMKPAVGVNMHTQVSVHVDAPSD